MFKNGSIIDIDILFTLLQHADNRFSYKMTSLRNNPDYIRLIIIESSAIIITIFPLYPDIILTGAASL